MGHDMEDGRVAVCIRMDVTYISLNSAAWATHFGSLAAIAASCDVVLGASGRICRDSRLVSRLRDRRRHCR